MKEQIIIFLSWCLLLVPVEIQGQGKKLGEGILKGLMFKHHYPVATKLGKPTDLYVQVKSLNSEWGKTIKKANYLTDDIIINRNLNQNKLILERIAPNWVLFDEPVQKVDWTGSETDLSTSFRITQSPPPGMTGIRVEEIWWEEGDSVPLARNFLNIEFESTQDRNHKAGKAKETRAKETKERAKNTKKHLFYLKKNDDYEKVRTECCDEFLGFLKHEGFINENFTATRQSNIAMSFVSFYLRWQKKGYVPRASVVPGAACYRFLTIDCSLVSATTEKAFGKFIHRTLNPDTKKIKNTESIDYVIEKKVNDWLLTHGATN